MILVVVTVALGVAVGYLRGGRLRALANVHLAGVWLLVAAFGAQALLTGLTALGVRTGAAGTVLLLASQVALVGFVWANRHLPGMVLVAVGFLMNAAVIVANGAMPVSPEAIAAVTGEPVEIAVGKHQVLEPGDHLQWLADVIPVAPLRAVVSVGDIVLAFGVAWLVAALLWPPCRHAAPRGLGARAHDRSGRAR